jgi:RimJ/RimL family protein N-acetyltransferase
MEDQSAPRISMNPQPVTLSGPFVRLEPLTLDHVPALTRVGLDPLLWRWVLTPIGTPDQMHAYVTLALDEQRRGVSLPFAIVDSVTGEVIGCTRYANIEPTHRRLEIGWTWLAASRQRSAANTNAKRLLLGHAFDMLGAMRVEFKTDRMNEPSRAAIARIGATQEGIFRKHRINAAGEMRDTVWFSILDTEWPGVRAKLDARLACPTAVS